ncbi:beta-galactosidase family protein [Agromyces sp. MMS24-JH15]|uniref:glycoside hydrolase family 35 protein n=1 Tax=Agromyces sp. MMS24-JH15 TaxID=3243765 RepID=UPI003747A45D
MPTFTIGEADFLLDGRPHRVIAGALHYFRVHPDQWADRIRKARLMGINTIETYVAWNAHEPRRGEWDATGWNDLGRFLDLVAAEGLHAIVRPGPYICAEWHNGGLPVWLTATPGIGLRRSEPQYVAEVTRYLERVYEIVEPRQVDRGGPVVLVQVENEYGAYGSDKEYLAELVRVTRDAGITVPLTTVDQPEPQMLRDGSLPGLHLTGSFGSRATERLATLREHQPTGPLMCSEFWDGWFDWWGGVHHTTDPDAAAVELDALLAAGASVNIYMFHGGTNFGLTNGANDKGRYLPITTSYDYDAPLDEAGNPTAKYEAFRAVIAKYADVPDERPEPAPAAPELEVALARVPLEPAVRREARHPSPPTFEALDHLGALVVYEAELPRAGVLEIGEVRDHAWVFVDGRRVGALARTRHERAIELPAGRRLALLVEEQGRVNYDARLGEAKGLIDSVLLDGEPLGGWTATPVDLSSPADVPGLQAFEGEFDLDAASDLFLDTSGWGKGYAFVNGTLLGRYWRNGPQETLFVPAPVTRAGRNRVVALELETLGAPVARFVAGLRLGPRAE